MNYIPPEIPGRETYWLTHRNRVHKRACGYTKNQHVHEWVAERGRSWREINEESERKGKIIWWCMRCFPQSHPALRAGGIPRRVGKKVVYF